MVMRCIKMNASNQSADSSYSLVGEPPNHFFFLFPFIFYLYPMRIHLIAIGGAVMHNLAMALHNKGFRITGSDDEIFEPSKSRLESYGLLPATWGWDPGRITGDLDGIILGMHARKDNPELVRAQELGLRIWSFPEYIYEQSSGKKRVVVGGSHGKTTVTSMIMHVLWYNHYPFDYMVGSQLEGFQTMVKLTDEAPVIILEGDEYLSSAIDPRPKFHLYKPHIAVLTGIAWDHMNVFPTFETYLEQFRVFISGLEKNDLLFWFGEDKFLEEITVGAECRNQPYAEHRYRVSEDSYSLLHGDSETPVPVFGRHNMQNIAAALHVCRELGVPDDSFYEAISSFRGAAKRQQLLAGSDRFRVFLDFAHAPSKVQATLQGFREAFPGKKIVTCLELHTFSSLNIAFLPQYRGTMEEADKAIVFFDPGVVAHKKLPPLSVEDVKKAFGKTNLEVIDNRKTLEELLLAMEKDGILLIMTSGNFSGIDLRMLAEKIAG